VYMISIVTNFSRYIADIGEA